jgi:cytoskeletal protein RodZ
MKAIPIILGVVIVGLLAALIFIPGRNQTNAPTATSTTNGTVSPTSTSPGTTGTPNDNVIYYNYTSTKGKIVKASIAPNQKITNPITFTGNVPAGWAFEASFPIDVRDANGATIGHGAAAVPNWMSTTTAWYSATISYGKSSSANTLTPTGWIIIYNDNPSGLAANSDSISIPVKF